MFAIWDMKKFVSVFIQYKSKKVLSNYVCFIYYYFPASPQSIHSSKNPVPRKIMF